MYLSGPSSNCCFWRLSSRMFFLMRKCEVSLIGLCGWDDLVSNTAGVSCLWKCKASLIGLDGWDGLLSNTAGVTCLWECDASLIGIGGWDALESNTAGVFCLWTTVWRRAFEGEISLYVFMCLRYKRSSLRWEYLLGWNSRIKSVEIVHGFVERTNLFFGGVHKLSLV